MPNPPQDDLTEEQIQKIKVFSEQHGISEDTMTEAVLLMRELERRGQLRMVLKDSVDDTAATDPQSPHNRET
jgi:hypothetical protein